MFITLNVSKETTLTTFPTIDGETQMVTLAPDRSRHLIFKPDLIDVASVPGCHDKFGPSNRVPGHIENKTAQAALHH